MAVVPGYYSTCQGPPFEVSEMNVEHGLIFSVTFNDNIKFEGKKKKCKYNGHMVKIWKAELW